MHTVQRNSMFRVFQTAWLVVALAVLGGCGGGSDEPLSPKFAVLSGDGANRLSASRYLSSA
jgi:hypothetical protein